MFHREKLIEHIEAYPGDPAINDMGSGVFAEMEDHDDWLKGLKELLAINVTPKSHHALFPFFFLDMLSEMDRNFSIQNGDGWVTQQTVDTIDGVKPMGDP